MSAVRSGRASLKAAGWCFAVVSVAACGTSDGSPAPSDSVDSDVQVVENSVVGVWSEDDAWSLEEVASVGGVGSEAVYQFGAIAGLDVDADGNIYVVDRQAQNVRIFDHTGAYLRTIGGPGEGPGEFGGNAAAVFVQGDRVVVPDPSNRRVSTFTSDGRFESDFRLDGTQGAPLRYDAIGEERLLVQRRAIVPGSEEAMSGDVVAELVAEGQAADTLVTFEPGQSVQMTGGIPKIHQFAPDPVWDSAFDGRLATGKTDEWRFRLYNAQGELQRIVSRPMERRPVTARDRRDLIRAVREMYRVQGVPPNIVEEVVEGMEFADQFPAFASLALGPHGSLWVQTLLTEEDLAASGGAKVFVEEMGSRVWDVVGADGRYLGQVTFPVRFEPVRVVDDLFYGIAKDDFDVESVKVYRLVAE